MTVMTSKKWRMVEVGTG